MSTKTTFKRVALIAVASLGLGVLTSVAPASAAVIVTGDIAVTGTAGTDGNQVLAGTAATVISTVTTATPLSFAWELSAPDGTKSVIGTEVANATVGTASAIAAKASTLTFATTFLTAAKAGKWTVKAVADTGAAGNLDTAAEITAAVLVGANTTTTNFYVYASTPTFVGGKGRTVTSATAIAQDANGTATVFVVADTSSTSYSATTTGVGSIQSAYASNAGWTSATNLSANATDTVTNNNGTTPAGGVTWVPTVKKGVLQLKISSSVAGTTTVSVTAQDANGIPGVPVTATITWGAAPVATSAVVKLAAGNDCSAGTATSVTVAKTSGVALAAGATTGASFCVAVKDQSGAALNGVPLDVTISGPGLVSITSNATTAVTGTTRTASLTATTQAATATAAIGITADGTAGTGIVTVTTGTTVLGTATVNFYGAVASVTATQVLKVAQAAGNTLGNNVANPTGADVANSPAVIVSVKDANGFLIPGLTAADIKADTSDAGVMSSTLNLTESSGAGAGNTAAKTYNVQVTSVSNTSGKSATLTFKVLGSDGVTYVKSAPITFKLGGTVATVALSLDKPSYSIGSAATATLTLKDSSGNAAYDSDYANVLDAALVSSYSVNKTLFGTTVSSIGGVSTVDFNAPVISGTWTITGKTGTGPATDKAKALTASASVSGNDVSALTTLVNNLVKKINALSALIAKIQKKLGVK